MPFFFPPLQLFPLHLYITTVVIPCTSLGGWLSGFWETLPNSRQKVCVTWFKLWVSSLFQWLKSTHLRPGMWMPMKHQQHDVLSVRWKIPIIRQPCFLISSHKAFSHLEDSSVTKLSVLLTDILGYLISFSIHLYHSVQTGQQWRFLKH